MVAEPAPELVLASASAARLDTLTRAGLAPRVVVSHVDEDAFTAPDVPGLVQALARAKAEAVAASLMIPARDAAPGPPGDGSAPGPPRPGWTGSGTVPAQAGTLVVGCDSLLELDGEPLGKPGTPEAAVGYWQRMRGRTGHLHTGHHVIRLGEMSGTASGVATTAVSFADLADDEITAYVASGEPLSVAGAFTIDGLGGAYVTAVDGDPHAVVGISLPLLRDLFGQLGVRWHTLWTTS
ncbi:Maf family protein [Propionicimonas sp.]|uniref:Maf family protein n=1 Tax=Propionicimonas sp. TaxID=1955623 RepID=UPI0039E4C131